MGNLISTSNSYTKEELYTRTEIDNKIKLEMEKMYNKTEIDNKIKSEMEKIYNKTEIDNKLSVLNAVWCVDGQFCSIPNTSTGLKIGDYMIERIENNICLKSNMETYCFDGKIIYKK